MAWDNLAAEVGEIFECLEGSFSRKGRWTDFNGYLYLDDEGRPLGRETREERRERGLVEKLRRARERAALPPKARAPKTAGLSKQESARRHMQRKRQNPNYRAAERAEQKEYRERSGMREKFAQYARDYRARKKAAKLAACGTLGE